MRRPSGRRPRARGRLMLEHAGGVQAQAHRWHCRGCRRRQQGAFSVNATGRCRCRCSRSETARGAGRPGRARKMRCGNLILHRDLDVGRTCTLMLCGDRRTWPGCSEHCGHAPLKACPSAARGRSHPAMPCRSHPPQGMASSFTASLPASRQPSRCSKLRHLHCPRTNNGKAKSLATLRPVAAAARLAAAAPTRPRHCGEPDRANLCVSTSATVDLHAPKAIALARENGRALLVVCSQPASRTRRPGSRDNVWTPMQQTQHSAPHHPDISGGSRRQRRRRRRPARRRAPAAADGRLASLPRPAGGPGR